MIRMRVIKQAIRGTVDPMVLTDEEWVHMVQLVNQRVEELQAQSAKEEVEPQ